MSKDITDHLKGWDYNPGAISARWIEGKDGRVKVQLRLDLGLFQMEVDGRPDGQKPHGYTSLVDYYQSIENTTPGSKSVLRFDEELCSALQQEAMQYYYRYLSFYALHYLEGVIQDTEHNLALIALVSRFAVNEDLAWQFQQFYPYVLMMNARATAEKSMEAKSYEKAIGILEKALDDIRAFWAEHGDYDTTLDTQEVELLSGMLRQIQDRKPRSQTDRLQEELDRAVAVENYEKAAVLRDAIEKLGRRKGG